MVAQTQALACSISIFPSILTKPFPDLTKSKPKHDPYRGKMIDWQETDIIPVHNKIFKVHGK